MTAKLVSRALVMTLALLVMASVAMAEGDSACTITIDQGGPIVACAGQQTTVSATVDCGVGALQVRPPEWTLDGSPIGTGNEITFTVPVGSYVLMVSCGSCSDGRVVNAVDCAFEPDLDAIFSDDGTENTTGVFLYPNIAPVTPGNYEELKYHMRPFTLTASESLTTGGFAIEATGGILEVYIDGSEVALPHIIPWNDLPATLMVNATGTGEASLMATFAESKITAEPETADTVKVRVGPFPGLAGREVASYPHFEFVQSFNDDEIIQTAVDPTRHSERTGLSYRVYVVDEKTPAEWALNNTLVDVSGGYETRTVTAGSITGNVVNAWTTGLDPGGWVGKGYDVVYDFGLDGTLDPGDMVDGVDYDQAGCYVVGDLNLGGPLGVTMIQYEPEYWLAERTYYPTDIGSMGQLPLVVISHGNGHQYTWYDYLGYHLASFGYVVMSHRNETGPGIETASTTTLTNTDYILAYQDTIGGGVMNGHIDGHRITWIGHSRGAEGVARAYDRLHDEGYTPNEFVMDDIQLVSSIAPTVFLGVAKSDPHDVNYHLMAGAADGDVTGGADCALCQFFRISQVATGNVQVTYFQGVGHNEFNCCGFHDATGPDQIGRASAQVGAKSYYLAMIDYYIKGNMATRDYLTRMYDLFRPSGVGDTVVIATQYQDALATGNFFIDDYQTETSTGVSSSGGTVTFDVSSIDEGKLNDNNTSFTWLVTDPMNGMTQASAPDDHENGVVFDWTVGEDKYYEFEVIPAERDFSDDMYLSFRTCQGTRHPETVGLGGVLDYTVTLRDGNGTTSSINFNNYGTITEPYQRTGLGTGAGWANEFKTVRIRLADFENDASGIDLKNIVAVRFDFGGAHGTNRGRIGIDDVELTKD